MFNLTPKITLVVFVGLLAIYHHAITTTISSISSSLVGPGILARVPAYVSDGRANKQSSPVTRQKFEDAWDVIRSELFVYFEEKQMPVDAQNWYKRVSPRTTVALHN